MDAPFSAPAHSRVAGRLHKLVACSSDGVWLCHALAAVLRSIEADVTTIYYSSKLCVLVCIVRQQRWYDRIDIVCHATFCEVKVETPEARAVPAQLHDLLAQAALASVVVLQTPAENRAGQADVLN